MGSRASDVAREWSPRTLPGLPVLHGLSVEMAEGFAEYVHKRIRGELGFAAENRATTTRCWPKAIAAAAIRSATPPAPTSPTSANYSTCSAPRRSASR